MIQFQTGVAEHFPYSGLEALATAPGRAAHRRSVLKMMRTRLMSGNIIVTTFCAGIVELWYLSCIFRYVQSALSRQNMTMGTYNKIPIYPIFYLLKGGCMSTECRLQVDQNCRGRRLTVPQSKPRPPCANFKNRSFHLPNFHIPEPLPITPLESLYKAQYIPYIYIYNPHTIPIYPKSSECQKPRLWLRKLRLPSEPAQTYRHAPLITIWVLGGLDSAGPNPPGPQSLQASTTKAIS